MAEATGAVESTDTDSAGDGSVGHRTWAARPPANAVAVRVIAFVVGGASLGTEIAAARLLAPYFGASTIIWANTIATVLVALSAGYALGGRLADRRADLRGLCLVVLVASVLLATVPFVADPFLRLSVNALGSLSVGGFVGSLVAVLVLVAVPVMLLGAVAPYASRLSVRRVADTGRTIGNLYAISTVGSLVGTFLAALLLIPTIGTHRTFIVFALSLALVAAAGVRSWRLWVVPVVVGASLAVPPAAIGAGVAGGRVIFSTETQYQYARVIQFRDGVRWLQLNEGVAVHSLYRPGTFLTNGYWDDFLVLPFAGRTGQTASPSPPRRIAILGDAAGTAARAYGHFYPSTRVDAVELDGELTTIGKRYFHLSGPRLHLYTADARPWLEASHVRYDSIFLDAYRQPYIPFYLITHEFFELARAHLQTGGTFIVNVGHLPNSAALEKVVSATLHSAFPYVMRDPFSADNSLLIASTRPLSGANMIAANPRIPLALQGLLASVSGRLVPALTGGPVYTDDWAPVEWLTDLSILRYAAGNR
ncbi:MAG TPA: fused MFS/spermidine synthase [Solirubrobacteraceae bacterium]|jgi:spermidine synthase|nr:fused MFS/spermidine synthase [Solirubrobacteraceae bacterium]